MSVRSFPAGWSYGDAQPGRARQLSAELVRRRPARSPRSAASCRLRTWSRAPKRRLRAESFADHYSQARQFFISQTRGEQHHIAAALTFELSKVKTPVIRERMVSHLLNIDETLAGRVGTGLGLKAMPKPADAAMPTRQDLDAIAEAQHRRKRAAALRRPQARHSRHRRHRRRIAESAAEGARPRKAPRSKSSPRKWEEPRPATAAGSRPTR